VVTSFSSLRFFIKEFTENLRRSPFVAVTHGLQVVISLMVLGFFIILAVFIGAFLFSLRNMVEVYVFLKTDLAPERYVQIDEELRKLPGVKEFQYISREDALKKFSESYHLNVEDILEYNPLPPTYILRPAAVSQISELATQAEAIDGVWQVRYGRKEVSSLMKVLLGMQVVFGITMLLLLSAAISSINNIIRMSVYGRRNEIRIMQLVGATNWFIRWPFMLEGAFFGTVGAVVALVVIYLIGETLLKVLEALKIFIPSLVNAGLMFFLLTVGLILIGFLIGVTSSYMTANRFLNTETRRIEEMRRMEAGL
jgi:cell division transport system permease protein